MLLLVGSGNNGGDALWAGAMLAARGCRVDALCLSRPRPRRGRRGAATGRRTPARWADADDSVRALVAGADLVVDGILGIGGTGGLRPDAAAARRHAVADAGALVVAVDLPSGVDADTGVVGGTAVSADVTVTFGALKPGLLVAPGRYHRARPGDRHRAGVRRASRRSDPRGRRRGRLGRRSPTEDAYKYRRGVVGVCAGSRPYPGAALLVTQAARHANVGMVRYLDRADGNAPAVVGRYPDVVVDGEPPAEQVGATAWACGPGFVGDAADAVAVRAVLAARVPVVLDAGALTVVAEDADVRAAIADRASRGLPTVLTPHEGEFERMQPGLLAARRPARRAPARPPRRSAPSSSSRGRAPSSSTRTGPRSSTPRARPTWAPPGPATSSRALSPPCSPARGRTARRMPAALTEATAAAVWLHGRAGREAAIDACP